ncbi:NAD(P)H-binding protein [Actinomadura macra]|uniref:NAD(P)H-binding protein n=1 Tax=Actinomadura macra TaxID=46164 RepID=UPI000833E11F|nr:NAD(P)H-binding protein [Actinomadura macra]
MILVTGATGNVGADLVRILVAAGRPVRALVRTLPSTRTDGGEHGSEHSHGHGVQPGVEHVLGDLNEPASLAPALDGVTGVFLLPGYHDMAGVLDEARRAGVERVVQLSGGSAGSGDLSNAVTRYMVRTEQAVYDSGLPWTVLRPSAFMSNALRWLPQLRAGDTVRLPFAGVRAATVDPYDIAAVAAAALLDDGDEHGRTGGHQGRIYHPTGGESLLPAEQVRVLAEVLGRDLRFEAQPDDEARAEMSRTMPPEYVDAFFDFYVKGTLDESIIRPDVQVVTGRPPRTFRAWAEAHRAAFQA